MNLGPNTGLEPDSKFTVFSAKNESGSEYGSRPGFNIGGFQPKTNLVPNTGLDPDSKFYVFRPKMNLGLNTGLDLGSIFAAFSQDESGSEYGSGPGFNIRGVQPRRIWF